jgi:hypothetical protein
MKKHGIFGFLGIALAIALLATVYSAVTVNTTLSSSGRIVSVNLNVYSDSGRTEIVSSVDWGNLEPGDEISLMVWIENTGNSAETVMVTTDEWSPAGASEFLVFSSNANGMVLAPNEIIQANLTLSVSPDITGIETFGFDIIITGVPT